MLDLKVNVIIWGTFMSATMKTAVHLGLDHEKNLLIAKNTDFEELKTLFDITQKLILEQKKHETKGGSTISMACYSLKKIHFAS